MSIAVLEKQISRFLASETAEVMSIRGAWGVGKTYAWNRFLQVQRRNRKLVLKNIPTFLSSGLTLCKI